MEPFYWILLGLLGGWFLARKYAAMPATEANSLVASTAPVETRAEAEPYDAGVLALRLHALSQTIEPFANDAAHANEIAAHPEFRKAVALLTDPKTPLETVVDYAFGQHWTLSCVAFAALKERSDGATVAMRVPKLFDGLSVWQMRFAFDFLASASPRPAAGAVLVGYKDWWNDSHLLPRAFADYFTALGENDPAELGPDVAGLPVATRRQIKALLGRIHNSIAERLAEQIADVAEPGAATQVPGLGTIGRIWKNDREAALIVEPEGWKESLDQAERLFGRQPARGLLVSGEPLTGKTAFLRLLARRVEPKGWRVFEASGADLQAGQLYIGQLEGRIREVVEALDVRNKIIWYVPDLLGLALSGTHQAQSASILDQIMPAISSGRLLIWTEALPANAARLLQVRPAARRLLEIVRLEAMPQEESRTLADTLCERLGKETGAVFQAGATTTAVEVAQHYLTSTSLPGSALSLIKMTVQRSPKVKGHSFTGHDILETLSQVTGLPLAILDGNERINLVDIRNFFTTRVIGQQEAVDCIVERIAMLKSGLNDPAKPIGVFLFAGPTGTGKTELAKTVSEYLFGSAGRTIRLDMSEYQTPEAVTKLLGGGGLPADAETLVQRIRKQPFSLVLLDEFEKSSPQIWDLFLQVFDEGRLTDAQGHTADFRHCLIILTTNLGATVHRQSGLGFTPSVSAFTNEQVMRTISQTFRPEFQNRLDNVIVFKPLTRELMRGILRKELDRLFDRRGLKDRDWAIEWDASALEFLLEKGFSPEMGARPLKRAIDQYVVAPLAETIVERRFPEGDQFVFVRRDGGALKAEFVDPDGETADVVPAVRPTTIEGDPPTFAEMILTPQGTGPEISALDAALLEVMTRLDAPEWRDLKDSLSGEINDPEFWTRADRFATLMRLELMDRLAVATETAQSLKARLSQRSDATGKRARDLIARLAQQIHLVTQGLKDLDERAPSEVAVAVEPVFAANESDGAETEWGRQLSAMYRNWAARRNMTYAEVGPVAGFAAPVLTVAGFGAYRTLARELGLHVREGNDGAANSARLTARVILAVLPAGNLSKAAIRQALGEALSKGARPGTVVRRYRFGPAPLVRNADGSWRSGKVDEVLSGDFDLLAH